MINLADFFDNLGVVSINTEATRNFKGFYTNVVWLDGTITNTQYAFYKKALGNRYEFFKQYVNETEFYSNINDVDIWDFKTFYENVNNGICWDTAVRGGETINVEDCPLLWIKDLYYNTYKGNTFIPVGTDCIESGKQADYAAITSINLISKSLTTDFTSKLLSKFPNLQVMDLTGNAGVTQYDAQSTPKIYDLRLESTSITDLDCSGLTDLGLLFLQNTQLNNLNVTGCNNLSFINAFNAKLVNPNFNNLPNLSVLNLGNNTTLTGFSVVDSNAITSLNVRNTVLSAMDLSGLNELNTLIASNVNTLTSLDISNNIALRTLILTNSNNINDFTIDNNPLLINVDVRAGLSTTAQEAMLIKLDAHGKSNGIFQGRIADGGIVTPAGLAAKNNLQAKGWSVLGF